MKKIGKKNPPPPPPQDSSEQGYCFHILSDSLSLCTQNKLQELEKELNALYPCRILIHFLSGEEFKDSPKWANHTNHLTYFRIKLASVLPQEIDRCLYLDIDMLVLQPLEELFALDLGENIAAVVLDCSNPYQEKRLKARDSTQADFVFPFRKEYFNAGFMLINLKKWRESQVESRALKFMRTFITRVGDQDILNAVIGKETLKLPPKWNFFINHFNAERLGRADNFCADESKNCLYGYTSKQYQESLRQIAIVHYTFLGAKPWENECKILDTAYLPLTYPYYATWWEIALQTPIFNQELKELLNNLKERALQDYAKALSGKLLQLENKLLLPLKNKISPLENELSQLQARMQKVEESQKIYGAKKRVQNHLNYKLGVVIVESQNIFKKVILPFRMARIVYLHKKQLKILQSLYALNPQLKPPALSRYSDLQEALSYQNSVFYQTGERFLNSCKQWFKGKFIKIL
ncbi:glycosyltransferase family 8 protein [Helicobacter sp. UBA3407]|uniref:glycosyltransferase family 8 protein n=1 Tax=Helicobacter sp. UBA3407 TaxID=1946588 RepID=UPI0026244A37|nr:glycosyltransferase family 8 protein [Helicobacter sp. UBA3407]